MKIRIINIFLIIIFSVSFAMPAFAHPGRTDASGCHTNRKTGDYHCHGTKIKKARTEARGQAKKDDMVCSYNAYNCSDFSSKFDAQSTYEACLRKTGKDVHDLDRDNDGDACESLK